MSVAANAIVGFLREHGYNPTVMWTREIDACEVDHVAIPSLARRGGLSWASDPSAFREWRGSVMIAVTSMVRDMGTQKPGTAVLLVSDPRAAMAAVMRKWFASAPVSVRSGDGVNVHVDAVVGCEGFGYVPAGDGWEAFPSVAGVDLGDLVDVGACAVISRGCMTDTVIGDGTKIGHGVHVGRGARIGKHCLVAPNATVGGSAIIGDRVKVWMGAAIANGVRVGDDAVIGMGAVVLRDVPAGETWAGNPARRIRGADGC